MPSSMFLRRASRAAAVIAASACAPALAATSVRLPAWACVHPDAIYAGAFDGADAAIPHDPSNGSGGAAPGKRTRSLHIAGLGSGTQAYYLYVPSDYTPARSWPLLLVLHGVGPYPDTYAAATRDDWVTAATAGHFIVAAPTADEVGQFWDSTTQQYVPYVTWLVPPSAGPTDYDLFAAIRADLEGAYNIERTRIYGWGFSAGASVMHDLGVNTYNTAFNASTMAAYSASAGTLGALACAGYSQAACGQLLAGLPRQIPVDIHIGDSDPNYAAAQADYSLLQAQGWLTQPADQETVYETVFSGGHTYTIAQLSAIWTNLCPHAVIP